MAGVRLVYSSDVVMRADQKLFSIFFCGGNLNVYLCIRFAIRVTKISSHSVAERVTKVL